MAQASLKPNKRAGLAAVEALVSAAVLLALTTGIVSAMNLYLRAHTTVLQSMKATFLEQEAFEAVRYLRDSGWDANVAALPTGTDLYAVWNGTGWTFDSTPSVIDSLYVRTVRFDEAFRDGSGDLAGSGSAEQDARKVTVSVTWTGRTGTTTRATSSYILNLFET